MQLRPKAGQAMQKVEQKIRVKRIEAEGKMKKNIYERELSAKSQWAA
jgi:hypothetical protein